METKRCKTDSVPTCPGRFMFAIAAVRPSMLAATVINMECRVVSVCFQAGEGGGGTYFSISRNRIISMSTKIRT
jgi:hypothetical protein